MPKSSQKAAGAEQSANQRGKNRFGSSTRPARVVLPERPPRAVDNEIVSILLGADPASLTKQATEASKAGPPELAEIILPSPSTPEEALVTVSPDSMHLSASTALSPETDQFRVYDFQESALPAQKALDKSVSTHTEELIVNGGGTRAAEISTPAHQPALEASERRAERSARRTVHSVNAQDEPISSFEEFSERWRHGLRKGQLKICEVLYQKTYAIGQTECVTSFSELGRLSGLQMRQCFNVIAQLEALKFVERSRSIDTSNKKDQGSVIRFHLFPVH